MDLVQRQSHIISQVLSPATRLWLRSQVTQVKALNFQITGGDRQILTGYIPQVMISAQEIIYRGLHLSQLDLAATGIRINIGQVIKGKPLRLLASFPIAGELVLRESDLNASLAAPLFAEALSNLLLALLQTGGTAIAPIPSFNQPLELSVLSVAMTSSQLVFNVQVQAEPVIQSVQLKTRVDLLSEHELLLKEPCWSVCQSAPEIWHDLPDFKLDLGTEVSLEELAVQQQAIRCRGRINVIPAD
jgi:hypothetical protein